MSNDNTPDTPPPGNAPSKVQRVLAEAARFIAAVPEANEYEPRRKGETRQQHEDRISDAIQANEDRRELLRDIEAAIASLPAAD